MISSLSPSNVFSIFEQITHIPRPSKHEQLISRWLLDFAAEHHIEAFADEAMNVIMRVPATPGYESRPGVILQAHMDMVCEKNADVQHDFMTDPIDTYVDGDWLKARGTTLGGDDGIGIAMALAALTDAALPHPALEALFTVDEETGLTGASMLKDGCLNGSRLINLDSEDDGQIFIGCAGGIDTLAKMHYEPLPFASLTTAGTKWFAAGVNVSGLQGGHSGDDIDKNRANANKLLVRFLYETMRATDMQLVSFAGGNLRNAIAREAEAVILVPWNYKETLRVRFNEFTALIEAEYAKTEPDMRLALESDDLPASIIPADKARRLITALYACPHGVYAMSQDMPGLVETSTNLASVRTYADYVEVNTSQRSGIESKKRDMMNMVEAALSLACDEVTHGDGYPGWAPNPDSPLLKVVRDAYVSLFGSEPVVRAIHAGLECGLFLGKYPNWDMVSIGPQMYGVHSPQERLSVSSTERCYRWLCETLKRL